MIFASYFSETTYNHFRLFLHANAQFLFKTKPPTLVDPSWKVDKKKKTKNHLFLLYKFLKTIKKIFKKAPHKAERKWVA